MNDQLAMMPAQLAMRCIQQCLRGGLPLVLGIAAITVGGTVFGAVKGVSACKNALTKPKAGENDAKKIIGLARKDKAAGYKEAGIHAFELDKKFYKAFAKEAKELGVAYAATEYNGIVHLIADARDKQVVEMLATVSQRYNSNASKNKDEPQGDAGDKSHKKSDNANDTRSQVRVDTDDESNIDKDDLKGESYKQVDFKDSLWNKIITFIQDKVLAPFVDISDKDGIKVDTEVIPPEEASEKGDEITFVSYNNKNKAHKADMSEAVEVLADEIDGIKDAFGDDFLKRLDKEISKDKFSPVQYNIADQDPLDELLEEFYNHPSMLTELECGGKTNGAGYKIQPVGVEQEQEQYYSEINDWLSEEFPTFADSYIAENPDAGWDEVAERFTEKMRGEGFKGIVSYDVANEDITIDFDPKDKNQVTAFARNRLSPAQGVSDPEMEGELLESANAADYFQLPNNLNPFDTTPASQLEDLPTLSAHLDGDTLRALAGLADLANKSKGYGGTSPTSTLSPTEASASPVTTTTPVVSPEKTVSPPYRRE